MRIPIIAANWKMNKTVAEALEFIEQMLPGLTESPQVEVVICPPFTAIYPLGRKLEGTGIGLGAQDVYWEEAGAFTGEVSPVMLKEAGSRYVIIGHSERRQLLGETDLNVNKKVVSALKIGLCPILCVGETLEERQSGRAREVVKRQLGAALAGVAGDIELVVAYEPVWAIGTGVNASAEDAREMSSFIRQELVGHLGAETAAATRILYGGSVKPGNIDSFMKQVDIDGALVGGASLDPQQLVEIVRCTKETVYG